MTRVACLAIAFFAFFISGTSSSHAATTPAFSYQGQLTDAARNPLANVTRTMTFRIYDVPSGLNAPLKTPQTILVTTNSSGVFSVLIDTGTLPFNDTAYYLGVQVDADQEMTPRKQLASVPQALNANSLDGDGYINIQGDASILGGHVGIGTAADGDYGLKIDSGDILLNSGGVASTAFEARDNYSRIVYDNGGDNQVDLYFGKDDTYWSGNFTGVRSSYLEMTPAGVLYDAQYYPDGWGMAVSHEFNADFRGLNSVGDGYTALKVNVADAQSGADGNRYLMDLQVDGNSKFLVDSTGTGLFAGSLGVGDTTDGKFGGSVVGSVAVNSDPHNIALSGNYAYVSGGSNGLTIVDVTDPKNPQVTGSYTTNLGNTPGLALYGSYALLTDFDNGKLVAINIANSNSPVLGSEVATSGSAHSIALFSNYAYVANAWSGNIDIFDVMNPDSLSSPVNTFNTGGYSSSVYISGGYLYVGDYYSLKVYDIAVGTTPDNPVLVGEYANLSGVNHVVVSGSYAYVETDSDGVIILDISNPTSPFFVSRYQKPNIFLWNISVSNDRLYVPMRNGYLAIVNVADPYNPVDESVMRLPVEPLSAVAGNGYVYVIDYGGSALKIVDPNKADLNDHNLYVQDIISADRGVSIGGGTYDPQYAFKLIDGTSYYSGTGSARYTTVDANNGYYLRVKNNQNPYTNAYADLGMEDGWIRLQNEKATNWNRLELSDGMQYETSFYDVTGGDYSGHRFNADFSSVTDPNSYVGMQLNISDSNQSSLISKELLAANLNGQNKFRLSATGGYFADQVSVGVENIEFGNEWKSKGPSKYWRSIAMSGDGRYQIAGAMSDYLYVSNDFGETWNAIFTDLARTWSGVAVSNSGSFQSAVAEMGKIYVSTDYGSTWVEKESDRSWSSISMSSDGSVQSAISVDGIYVSYDYGNNWTLKNGGVGAWDADIALSDDGSLQAAAVPGNQVYISTDSGNSWTAKDTNRSWTSVAVSGDGSIQIAGTWMDGVYVSSDFGETWNLQDLPNMVWSYVAISADGSYQTAVALSGQIYISTDSGATWNLKGNWGGFCVAMSDDGLHQAVGGYGGPIYEYINLAPAMLTVKTNTSSAGAMAFQLLDSNLDSLFSVNDYGNVGIRTDNPNAAGLDIVGLTGQNKPTFQVTSPLDENGDMTINDSVFRVYPRGRGVFDNYAGGQNALTINQQSGSGNILSLGNDGAGEVARVDYDGNAYFNGLNINGDVQAQNITALNSLSVASQQGSFQGFTSIDDYGFSTNPQAIDSGDLNADGYPDLAVGLNDAHSLAVSLNNGNRTFASPIVYSNVESSGVAIGDLNNDGYGDIASTGYAGATPSVFISLNNGDGTFSSAVTYTTDANPNQIVIQDLNNDGNRDLAVLASGTISILLNNGDGTFGVKSDFAVDSGYSGIDSGDLDGDGDYDLVTANWAGMSVSIMLNDGAGSFSRSDLAVGYYSNEVSVGDLNGDGSPDLAVANNNNNMFSVFLNDGSGNFSNVGSHGTPGSTRHIKIEDMDVDGDNDVVTLSIQSWSLPSWLGILSVFTNDGSGSFSEMDYSTSRVQPYGMTSGDFNMDGEIDWALAVGPDDLVSVFINQSSLIKQGLYASAVTGNVGIGTVSPLAGLHLENNGSTASYNDGNSRMLMGTDFMNNPVLELQTGATGFSRGYAAAIDFSVSDGADFNSRIMRGNGTHGINDWMYLLSDAPINLSASSGGSYNDSDLFIDTAGRVGIGTNNPMGILNIQGGADSDGANDPYALVFNYRNGGYANRITTRHNSNTASGNAFDFYLWDQGVDDVDAIGTKHVMTLDGTGFVGIGITQPSAQLEVYGSSNGLRLSYDGSNYSDFATNSAGDLTVDPSGTGGDGGSGIVYVGGDLLPTVDNTYYLGSTSNRWRDIYVGNNSIHIGEDGNEGTISYNAVTQRIEFNSAGGLELGPTNTDSLVVSPGNLMTGTVGFSNYLNISGGLGTGGTMRLTDTGNLTNIGSIQAGEMSLTRGGTFAAKVDYATESGPYDITSGDFNGDGKADLAIVNFSFNTVSVLMNDGVGNFPTRVEYSAGPTPLGVAAGDLNGDGSVDLAIANNGTVTILLNNGEGAFGLGVEYPAAAGSRGISIGDLNGDGSHDVVVVGYYSSTIAVLMNDGNGAFTEKVEYPADSWPANSFIADLNGDGSSDIVESKGGSGNQVSVFLNNGHGVFAPRVVYTTSLGAEDVSVSDLNGDSKPDIVATGVNDNKVSVLMGMGDGTFMAKVDYATGSSPRSVVINDFNGDGRVDLAVSNYTNNTISILTNNGDGSFANKVDYATGSTPYFIAASDFNGDGKVDLAASNNGSNTVSILFNQAVPMLYTQASTGNIGIGTNILGNLLTLGSYNAGTSSSLKQGLFSVDNMPLAQLEGGAYFGRTGIEENQWGLSDFGNLWNQKGSSSSWDSVAMSTDGKIQTAVGWSSYIWISSDYGDTWTQKGSSLNWVDVSMSADGKIQTAVVQGGYLWISTDYGDTWTQKGSSLNWDNVAMSADGKIQTAAVSPGYLWISTDYGNTWTQKGSSLAWYGIAMSADGKVQTSVATGDYIWISTDYGNTWTQKGSSSAWRSVAMSADGKIQTAVVDNGYIWISSDYGNTWTQKGPSSIWRSVAMSADGKIQTAVAAGGYIWISTDYGNTWTQKESPSSWRSVAMSADGKVQTVVVQGGRIYVSYASSYIHGNVGIGTKNPSAKLEVVGDIISKGTSWTARSAAAANTWHSVTYGNGLFVAVSMNGANRVMTSPDGINWTGHSAAGNDDYWEGIAYGNGLFVAVGRTVGDRVMTSPDGINWTARSAAGDNDDWFSVTYGEGMFVAVGSGGGGDMVMTSPDGINWTARSAAGDNDDWRSVTYGNGLFVAVSAYSDPVMTSPDGIVWTAQSAAGNNDNWGSVTYGNGLFVAVGWTGSSSYDHLMTSPDGVNWTARSVAGNNDIWWSIAYGNGLFVAVGNSTGAGDSVMTSPDGVNWTARSAAGDDDIWKGVVYGNGLFVAVGEGGDNVMTSGKAESGVVVTNNTYQGGMNIFGNVGIGIANPSYALDIKASGTGTIARFNSDNSTGCTLAVDGTIACTSDINLKKNIGDLEYGLDTLMRLRPVDFNWNYQADGSMKSLGFIAQDIEQIVPQLVTTDSNGYKQLNTIGLVPILARSIQEQQTQIAGQQTTLSSLSLQTDQNITTLSELQISVDEQLGVVSQSLNDQETMINDQASLIATLQTQIAELQTKLNAEANLAQVDLNTQEVQYLKTLLGIDRVLNPGDVDLLGKLSAETVETGALIIKVIDPAAATIGQATITPVTVDMDLDGIDDVTGSNGKSVVIGTAAVNSESKVYVTPIGSTNNQVLYVGNVVSGTSFEVKVDNVVTAGIQFNWWLVETK